MADIFISYASEDRDRIAVIVVALEKAGWTVFWDRKTPVGMWSEKHIEQNLQQAACVLVVWSNVSIDKDWVKIEARNGLSRGCLVPARIDPIGPPFGFDHVQFADLVGWKGDTTNTEWQELITAVGRLTPRKEPEPQRESTKPGPQGPLPPDLSHYWRLLLKAPSASELQQLTDEVQALRKAHPTNLELIKLQRRVTDFAEPQATRPSASPAARRSVLAVAAALVLVGFAIAAYLNFKQPSGALPDLVPIAKGCFTMGSPEGEAGRSDNEGPQHQVCLEEFRMGRHEVTFDQYDTFARATGHALPSDSSWGRGDRPVINVSWKDAQAYVQWLSNELESTCSLPNEAQWEYAARAGTIGRYALPAPTGSDNIAGRGLANCEGCGSQWDNQQTAPVGSFTPNAWDLYDMHGNVWEWAQDCWHGDYRNAPSDGSARETDNGGYCSRRVRRGGSWFFAPEFARSAHRNKYDPGNRYANLGFRVSCSGP